MPFTPTRLALAVLACALPAVAAAQTTNSVSTLDKVVVTASRTPQLEKDVLGDVTVIGKEELQKAGQNSVAEILARQPGVQINNTGGPQTVTSVFLRGAPSQHTQVLVDGIRINSFTTGATNWNAIDPALIERIEIVRGAGSSLYGSGASGGVVNIITKKGGEDRPLAAWGNIGLGSHGTFKSSLGISGAQADWDYALSTSMADSSGFSSTNATSGSYNRDRDSYEQHALSASLGYRWMPGHHIGVTAYNGYINGEYDDGPSDQPNTYSITRQQSYSVTSTDDITARWQSVLRFGYSKESNVGDGSWGSSSFGSQQRSYSWQNNVKFTDNQNLSLILERLEERPDGGSTYVVNRRDTNSAGLVYRGDFDRHHIQASVRNDNVTGYGNETTGGLSYGLDLDDKWRVGVAASTGFQAPSFSSLYYPADPYFQGNPNLKPETSRNIEASVKYTTDTTRLGLTAYQNQIKNMIVDVPDPSTFTFIPKNVNRATIRGLTFTAEQDFGRTTLRAGADIMNPVDDETGNQLQQRAKRVFRLGADHRIHDLTVGAEYQYTSRRYDDAANKTSLGGYSLVNLTAAYDFNENVGVQVRWDNVFDRGYTHIYGYNTPGSTVFVNLSVRM
jgi:vitamin B12 transporter